MSRCLRDVVISDVRARQCTACAGFFYGLAEMPVEGVKMQNVVVEMVDGAPGRPAMMDGCPEMQRAGFYLRNAADVDLRGVRRPSPASALPSNGRRCRIKP